jgi:hypothetical protein
MRHLRKFNEAVELSEYELEKFMKDNLAFIVDDGFRFSINTSRVNGPTKCSVDIFKGYNEKGHYVGFKWDKIKYDIIQFFELLDNSFLLEKNYRKKSIHIYNDALGNTSYKNEYSMEEILNEDTEFIEDITCISFTVVAKK